MLSCDECGRVAEGADVEAHGWKAYLADNPRDDEPREVAVYCPTCAEQEFADE